MGVAYSAAGAVAGVGEGVPLVLAACWRQVRSPRLQQGCELGLLLPACRLPRCYWPGSSEISSCFLAPELVVSAAPRLVPTWVVAKLTQLAGREWDVQ